ncbi:hypothetical protein BH23THE1_BH23THE1_16510 [soil metagenome]
MTHPELFDNFDSCNEKFCSLSSLLAIPHHYGIFTYLFCFFLSFHLVCYLKRNQNLQGLEKLLG